MERLSAYFYQNLSVDDKSGNFGMSSLSGLLDKKTLPATWNFYFQDGRTLYPQKMNLDAVAPSFIVIQY